MLRSNNGTIFESLPMVTIDGVTYEYLSIQREKVSAIYKSPYAFLRIGEAQKILKDLEMHKQMETKGFPVPKITSEGSYKNMEYFIEESLGRDHFGTIFKNEVEDTGKITDDTFDTFISLSEKWAEAQISSPEDTKDLANFEHGIHLNIICDEMPEEKEKIIATYKKIKEVLSIFPFATTHGDFGPFNMYPTGVIDLESSFVGPSPYDVGSLITHLDWFPVSKEYEYFQVYNFTEKQKEKYLSAIDAVYEKHRLPKVSDYLFELDLLKGIWFAARLSKVPKLQKFRYDHMRDLLNIAKSKYDIK